MHRFYYTLLLVLLNPLMVWSQFTSVPDTTFERYLINQGIDSDNTINGQIATADALGVPALNLGPFSLSGQIQNLSGIEAFTDLVSFFCYNQSVDSIDLTANDKLSYIIIQQNQTTYLNVQQLDSLRTLFCGDNNLAALDLSTNTRLERLNCENNSLNSLDLSHNNLLQELNCYRNSLTTLSLTNNNLLEELDCSDNSLSALDLTNNGLLKKVDCQSNMLSTINLINNGLLEELNAFNNPLPTIDLSSNTQLLKLRLSNAPLTQLNLQNNNLLQEIMVINIDLQQLDLSTQDSLKTFQATNNSLQQLALTNNTKLEHFDIKNTKIDSLNFQNCPELYYVRIEESYVRTLDMQYNTKLETLSCNRNRISYIDVSNSPDLKVLSCYINQLQELDLSANPKLRLVQLPLNQLTFVNLKNNNLQSPFRLTAHGNSPDLVICIDDYSEITSFWNKDNLANYKTYCTSNIAGTIAHDVNFNCSIDTLEPVIPYRFFEITGSTDTVYTVTNVQGRYLANLDTGNYAISLAPFNNYWSFCPSAQQVQLDNTNDYNNNTHLVVDWALQANVFCPLLVADISAPFLRSVGSGSRYTISYCNNGTVDANNAYIEVTLDTFLNVISTTLPIASQQGNVYTFLLDTINVGACDNFQIQVVVDTSAQLGQTLCSQVHIFPDSICNSPWTGPILNARANCQQDTVFFILKNTGSNMNALQNYTIFEDDIIIHSTPFNLPGGDSVIIRQPAGAGNTYRLEANQAIGYPAILGGALVHATVEGCKPDPNGGFNTGFVTQYYTGNSAPQIAVDCQPNIGAYDPNDKAAQPMGYGSQHYIPKNIPLTYRVRFQNTGNDTAFNVVILDTLSEHVLIPSLSMGASSHNYTWAIREGHILEVRFPHIKLVDSMTNEPLSHGFFNYTIEQQPNLNNGTVINNQAAIYFDYNPPIFTNTTFHTIGENFFIVGTQQVLEQQQGLDLTIYPNPTNGNLYIDNRSAVAKQLALYDQLGRVILEQEAEGKIEQLSLQALPKGIYYLRLMNNQQQVTKKIIKLR